MQDLVDSHCHLDFEDYGADRAAILDRARAAGIRAMVTIGSGRDLRSCDDAVALAQAEPDVWATVAVHPHDASRVDDDVLRRIRDLAGGLRVVAIGETGLDYHYDHSPREVQRYVFARFIALAREVRKPIVVHTRSAPKDTIAILRSEDAREVGGVIHCMSEDAAFAKDALDLDFDISFSGIVTFKKADDLREVARQVPADRILVETDAPFLAPIPYRGKRNEPAYILETVRCLAAVRGVSPDSFAEQTAANARKRFRLG